MCYLFIQKSPTKESAVEQFLTELCDSPMVKRPVMVYARRFAKFYGANGQTHSSVSSMSIEGGKVLRVLGYNV